MLYVLPSLPAMTKKCVLENSGMCRQKKMFNVRRNMRNTRVLHTMYLQVYTITIGSVWQSYVCLLDKEWKIFDYFLVAATKCCCHFSRKRIFLTDYSLHLFSSQKRTGFAKELQTLTWQMVDLKMNRGGGKTHKNVATT